MPERFYRASMVGAPDIDCGGLQWLVGVAGTDCRGLQWPVGAPGLHR